MTTTCHKTVVGVSKGMFLKNTSAPTKTHFCVNQISWRSQDCYKDEVKSGILQGLK